MRITKRVVDALKAGETIWDSELRGFGARRQKRDVSLVLKCTVQGRQRFITLGRHGVLTVEEARAKAKALVGQIAAGADPSPSDDARPTHLSVEDLCRRYLEEGPRYKPNKKAASWTTDRSNTERHILPLLGRIELRSLHEGDVVRFVQAVVDGATRADVKTGARGRALVRGGAGTASRCLAVLSAVLNFGVRVGVIEKNAAKYVKAPKGGQPGRFLSREEWVALGTALKEVEAGGTSPTFLNAIRLLALTGARKSEVIRLGWDEVNLESGTLSLKDSKVGARDVPLGEQAVALLRTMSVQRHSAWVFPSSRGTGPIVGLQKVWDAVRTAAGLHRVRLHDLRHSFASEAVSSGASLYLTGAVLGHRQPRTTQRYAHIQRDPVRQVATAAGIEIGKALS